MQETSRIRQFILSPYTIMIAYLVIATVAGIQAISVGTSVSSRGYLYTDYNNYVIFRQSFFHLLEGKNLYIKYLPEHWDLYKYSPTFALLFGVFAYLPDLVGLCLWNILNAGVLLFAVMQLPITNKQKTIALWFCLIELLTSLQNAQSNGLLAGLMILGLADMERDKPFRATLWLVASAFIKVYGAAAFIIFLFYPNKWKFIAYSAFWTVVWLVLPLVVVLPMELMRQYYAWGVMMSQDQAASYGWSVMGWLYRWFGLGGAKGVVTVFGVIFFFVPLLRWKLWESLRYRLLFLSHILVWLIIFNHKAESPTFIIAVAGVAIWYVASPRQGWRDVLLGFVFIGTVLSHTDLFPAEVRRAFIYPYVIKAFPCIVVWCVIVWELMVMKPLPSPLPRRGSLQPE
jgi:hypothetical protein